MNDDRPYIICHMMSTIDGKITSADQTDILSENYFDLYTKTEDMLEKQAWMLGRVTMQMFASKNDDALPKSQTDIDSSDFVSSNKEGLFMFGVDTKGILRWDKNTIKLSNVEIPLNLVIVVTTKTPKEYLAYLQEKNISYVFSGEDQIDLLSLFNKIKEKFGVEKLLLEGGGLLNGSVMATGFVDEISLLVTPMVVNQSGAPSLFENKDNKLNLQNYLLISAEKMEKEVVWLRYNKIPRFETK